MHPDSLYIHAFNLLPQFGVARLTRLAEFFPTFMDAYRASVADLLTAGIEQEYAEIFTEHRAKLNLEQQAELLQKENIHLLTPNDAAYPRLLLETDKYPRLLYYKGIMEKNDELCVAVVGTRKITNYGRTVAPWLIEPLVSAGAVIVSGLAFGVDAMAHKMAVGQGRRTIAVLGGGLDDKSLYPKEHGLLAQEILDNGGALVSEYPIGAPSLKHHFISRNRIISGMSLATLIVECGLKSGSLITAKYALEQNRTVFAVPGPIYAEQSQGPNNLIKMGAKLVTDVNDILDDLNLQHADGQQETQSLFGDSPAESTILQVLTREPISLNELIKLSGLSAGDAASALTFLEMKGRVRNLGAQQYILSR